MTNPCALPHIALYGTQDCSWYERVWLFINYQYIYIGCI